MRFRVKRDFLKYRKKKRNKETKVKKNGIQRGEKGRAYPLLATTKKNDYLLSMVIKRIADWLEKMSAGCIVAGIFQERWPGLALGVLFMAYSLYLTRRQKQS